MGKEKVSHLQKKNQNRFFWLSKILLEEQCFLSPAVCGFFVPTPQSPLFFILVLRGCTELKIVGEHLYFLLVCVVCGFFFNFIFFSPSHTLTDQNCKQVHCRDAGGPCCAADGGQGHWVSLQLWNLGQPQGDNHPAGELGWPFQAGDGGWWMPWCHVWGDMDHMMFFPGWECLHCGQKLIVGQC